MAGRPFQLPDTAFTALGAAHPPGETLDTLRRAERTRHLLLLRQVVRTVSDTPWWYADPPDDPMTALWATAGRVLANPGQDGTVLPSYPTGEVVLALTHALPAVPESATAEWLSSCT